jgi:hypothetical protein
MKKTLCSFVVTCCLVLLLGSFAEVLADPVANAGEDQVVFDEVTLDGSASSDPDSLIDILFYEWVLIDNNDPAFNITQVGPSVTFTGLHRGFYTVILTITYVVNGAYSYSSDVMSLAAAGAWVPTPSITAVTPPPDPGVLESGGTIILSGENFGDNKVVGSKVKIGRTVLAIVPGSWTVDQIEAVLPSYDCTKFGVESSIEKKIYVKVAGVKSNKQQITINATNCVETP